MLLQLQPATLTFRFAQRPTHAAYLITDQNGNVHLYAERSLHALRLRPIILAIQIITFITICILFLGVFGSYIRATHSSLQPLFVLLNALGCLITLPLCILPARVFLRERFTVYNNTDKDRILFSIHQKLTPFANLFTIYDTQFSVSSIVARRFHWQRLRRQWSYTDEQNIRVFRIFDQAQLHWLFQGHVNPQYSIVDTTNRPIAQFKDGKLTVREPVDHVRNPKTLICALLLISTEDQPINPYKR